MTVQDLRPNSQDTSAFYLGNIYEVLADPNVTRAPTPSPIAKPPPFSPPRYAVWVNSLWFLSLVMSLSCALWATSLHQWARRYIRLTQPARCSPEKRARMRAFFANGVDEMHIPWAVEGLPTVIHLSLFLFFGGLVIFLFNVNREVFTRVVWWIGLFSIVYGLITLLPLIRQDSPYYTPLSTPAWFPYARIQYVIFSILALVTDSCGCFQIWLRCEGLQSSYSDRMVVGVETTAKDIVEEQSSKIDVGILGWTLSALGDEDSLEKFFEAIPGFFSSRLVKDLERDFTEDLLETFWQALNGFMSRTLLSNSATEPVISRRDIICRDIISLIPCPNDMIRHDLRFYFDHAPVSIEKLRTLARWRTNKDYYVAGYALIRVTKLLVGIRERDDNWIMFASEVYGLAAQDLRDNIALAGDSLFLAVAIEIYRKAIRFDRMDLFGELPYFDIRHTLPGLQHDFCTVWNELIQATRKHPNKPCYPPSTVLCCIRELYVALHQGVDIARAPAFLYPLCNVASHRPDMPASVPASDFVKNLFSIPLVFSTRHGESPDLSPSPFHPTTHSEIGNSSQVYAAASSIHTSPRDSRPIDASPPVAPASQGNPPAITLSYPPEQRDIVASCAEPDTTEILFTTSPPAPSHAPPLPNAEIFALLSSTMPSRSVGDTTLPCLRARGLVNTGSMCFANAVLQLLAHTPPFWNMFKELGDLNGQRGAEGRETSRGATPLVDATIKFSLEFMFKEGLPPTQQPPQQFTDGEPREDEEPKKEKDFVDSFEPTYMYDAMNGKRRLKNLLVCSHAT